MQRVPKMPSTVTRNTKYDPATRTLSVWFVPSGDSYDYEDVAPATYAVFSLTQTGQVGIVSRSGQVTILTSNRPTQYMILCLSHAKNPFPPSAVRTRAAAQCAFMVAPT